MADIFSIFTGSKVTSRSAEDVDERFKKCLENIGKYGRCECVICTKKREVAYNLLAEANKELFKFMKDIKVDMYFEDILETLIIAARHVQRHINRENADGKEEK
jgi:hypothetical protein